METALLDIEALVPAALKHLFDVIGAEHALTLKEILNLRVKGRCSRATGVAAHTDRARSLSRSHFIPRVDLLSKVLQPESTASEGEVLDPKLNRALLLTFNWVAAGLKNTDSGLFDSLTLERPGPLEVT